MSGALMLDCGIDEIADRFLSRHEIRKSMIIDNRFNLLVGLPVDSLCNEDRIECTAAPFKNLLKQSCSWTNVVQSFDYVRPTSKAEVIRLLTVEGQDASVLAGGTDLIVGVRHRKVQPKLLVDLKRVDGFRAGITLERGSLFLPAGTTMTEIVNDARVQRHFPALVEAANVVGSVQIRNRATIAGNVCNASPAADTVPVLALYGATVNVIGPSGERTEPMVEFVLGNRKTSMKTGEFVWSITVPVPRSPSSSAFERITRRRGVDLATVNLSCLVSNGEPPRFALGAVSPRPLVVEGDGDLAQLFASATPISDVRAGADYRRAMLSVIGERALARARALHVGADGA